MTLGHGPSAAGFATLKLVSGDTLSLTPAMGWNSYDSFGGSVTEQETMDAATTLKAKLQPFGWNAVVVDYLWYDGAQIIDASVRYLPSPKRFASPPEHWGSNPSPTESTPSASSLASTSCAAFPERASRRSSADAPSVRPGAEKAEVEEAVGRVKAGYPSSVREKVGVPPSRPFRHIVAIEGSSPSCDLGLGAARTSIVRCVTQSALGAPLDLQRALRHFDDDRARHFPEPLSKPHW